MCDPVSATAVALSVAGSAAQSAGQSQANNARSKALTAERERQQGYTDTNYRSAGDTLEGVSRPAQDQLYGAAQGVRQGAYGAPISSVPFASPIAPTSPVIAGEFQRAGNTQMSKSLGEALAKANLDAYGDAQVKTGIRTNHNAQDIGITSQEAQNSQNVLPLELQNAQRKGQGLRTLGDLLTATGSIASLGGAGLFSSAAAAPKFGVDFGSKMFASPTMFA